ncbi:MAG TPA: hypothetical protein DCY13_16935, partial [Verrucomicrobiales bacterium]|nr:hypothetical protein [Verrucomicrobiales bacterium]
MDRVVESVIAMNPIKDSSQSPVHRAARRCTADGTRLWNQVVSGVGVFGCPTCGGLWLPAKSWRQICRLAGRSVAVVARPSKSRQTSRRGCPDCGSPDPSILLAGSVEVDQCPQCLGVWLDHGEIDRLAH